MSVMRKYEQLTPTTLPRTSSCKSTSRIIPANYPRSTSPLNPLQQPPSDEKSHHHRSIIRRSSSTAAIFHRLNTTRNDVANFLRSLISVFTLPATCNWFVNTIPAHHLSLTPSRRKVTGTLFGHRHGHVSFAVQENPRSAPLFLVELGFSTSALVKEMSSGLVRIVLECEKAAPPRRGGGRGLFGEPVWTVNCNGREYGHAPSRECTASDWHVLSTVQSVSVGAGVIPVVEDGSAWSEGELMYMRARFERVVGSRDSEAFYMLNPDGGGGPELTIFLLRI